MRLDVFSQKKLHAALAERGYDVSLRTVRRWIEGEATPNGAWSQAILEVLDIQKEAAPRIGERLDELLIFVRAIASATPGLDLAAMDDIHRRVLELERARRRPDVPDPSADPAPQDEPSGTGR